MTAYTLRIVMPPADPLSRVVTMESDADAVAFARQLLKDWPDCEAIEIATPGGMVDRVKPSRSP